MFMEEIKHEEKITHCQPYRYSLSFNIDLYSQGLCRKNDQPKLPRFFPC
jgi:hypothetical protein